MIRRRFSTASALLYGVLFVFALYFIAPLYVMGVASFKSLDEIRQSSIIRLPQIWTLEGWQKAWSTACTGLTCQGIQPYFIETFHIVLPALVFAVFLGALSGYVMSHWRTKASDIIFGALIIGSFIPLQLFLIPIALTLRELDLFGSTAGLILIHTIYGLPLTTLLFRNYYVALPDVLFKAALIDGAGFFKIFRSIILPLSPPVMIIAVILIFNGIYNDFLFALAFGDSAKKPIMAAVQNIINSSYSIKEYHVNMATVMIAALPTLFIFLVTGKFFVRGLAQGAVKG